MTTRPSLLIVSLTHLRSEPRVLKQIALFKDKYDVATCGMGPAPVGVSRHFELPSDSRNWTSDKVSLLSGQYRRAYWRIPAVQDALAVLPKRTFDGIVAHDVNTLPLAIALSPRSGVHADMHEFAPRVKENDLKWRLFVAPFIRWICRTYLPQVGSATTVASGIAAQYERDFGTRFGVVINAAPFADLRHRPVGHPIRLVHSGAAFRSRQIENYIEAMKGAPDGVTLDLMLVPNEPAYVNELILMSADMPQVRFRDPVKYDNLIETMSEYDVSLSFFPPTTFNLEHALPNKFFEAVQARIGVVIGPSVEMEGFVKEYGFGAITEDFSIPALRKIIQDLDPVTVGRWKSGTELAASPLSAEVQMRGWSEPIAALVGE